MLWHYSELTMECFSSDAVSERQNPAAAAAAAAAAADDVCVDE